MSAKLHAFRRMLFSPTGIIFVVSAFLLLANLAVTYHFRPFTSDEVFWQAILPNWHSFNSQTVTLGNSSVYVDKLPFYMLLDHLFGLGRRTLFIESALSALAGFSLFYASSIYFLKKLGAKLSYPTLLPFLWLASSGYNLTQLYLNPNWRGFQLGISFAVFALTAAVLCGDIAIKSWVSRIALAFVVSFVGLQVYSDPYILYFTIGPIMLLALFLLAYKHTNKRRIAIILGAAVASVIVSKFFDVLAARAGVRTAIDYPLEFANFDQISSNFAASIHSILIIFGADFTGRPIGNIYTLTALANLLLVVFAVYISYRAILAKKQGDFQNIWPPFFVLTSILVFGVYTFSTMAVGTATYRYFLLLVLLLALLLAVFVGTLQSARLRYLITCLLAGAIVLNTGTTFLGPQSDLRKATSVNRANSFNFRLIAELDKADHTKGYTNYWQGAINTYLSKNTISFLPVLCIQGQTTEFHWLINDNAYAKSAPKSFYLIDPDVAEPATCTFQELVHQFGQPQSVKTIDNKTLLEYNYDIGSKIK